MENWQLQDAKNCFSEVVKKALLSGPQMVTKRGVETVVVISVEEYRKLTKPKTTLTEFFNNSPLKNSNIDLERIKEYPREIDLWNTLDTCVISELIKPRPNSAVVSWINSHLEENFYLTSITIGEIQRGISKLTESKKKKNLQTWLDSELIVRFDRRILSFGLLESKVWGKIQAQAEKEGNKMPILDGLMTSIAIVHDMGIATRNISDMEISGVDLINPWK